MGKRILWVLTGVILVLSATAVPSCGPVEEDTTTTLAQLAAPVIETAAGFYTNSVTVTISSSEAGATVKWSTNGGTVWVASSTALLSNSATLLAKASKAGLSDSANASAAFHVVAWRVVGSAGFSVGIAQNVDIDMLGGIPVVVYRDIDHDGHIVAKSFDGNSWNDLGSLDPGNEDSVSPSLAVDNGDVYVAYCENSNPYEIKVMKLASGGSSWLQIGSDTTKADLTKLAVSGGVPYVFYRDITVGKANVRYYDGSSWANLGSAAFSSGQINEFAAFTFYKTYPIVAFTDMGEGNLCRVMKYTNGDWKDAGTLGDAASSHQAHVFGLATNDSYLYIGFRNDDIDGYDRVRFGSTGFWMDYSCEYTNNIAANDSALAIFNNRIYVASATLSTHLVAFKYFDFIGSKWVCLGTQPIAYTTADDLDMTIDPNGVPYVAFQDSGNGGKITVIKYGE